MNKLARGPDPAATAAAPAPTTDNSAPAAPEPESGAASAPAPAPPTDVWERLRAGLVLPASTHPDVVREIKWFAAHPRFLERVAVQARPYLQHIVTEVARRGMPAEVTLLPIVESAFDPRASSSNRAAGLWQFIPGTARRYGLEINPWYDGRRDPVASTRAALDYLEILHSHFGEWKLTLAAYNCGEATMARAQAAQHRLGGKPDFWSLRLPRETRRFLPRLLAVAAVVRDPARYGHRLEFIPDLPFFHSQPAPGGIDLAGAAQLAGIDAGEFTALNAGWIRGITAPNSTQSLHIPVGAGPAVAKAVATMPRISAISATAAHAREHRIRPGESLGSIAHRYGVSIDQLKTVNDLRGSLIRAGSILRVPAGRDDRHEEAPVAVTVAADRLMHTVRHGDTLWDIARQYGVSVQHLREWNALDQERVLALGEQLRVRPETGPAAAVAMTAPPEEMIEYRVKSGDSLWRIARRHDVRVADLRRWNRLPTDGKLQPGQALRIHMPGQASGVRI